MVRASKMMHVAVCKFVKHILCTVTTAFNLFTSGVKWRKKRYMCTHEMAEVKLEQ